jgi:GNAT superfamily N-acetyltransferase
MIPRVVLRPPRTPDDYPELARILTAAFPAWPITADELADGDRKRSPRRLHRKIVAELGEGLAGYGFVEVPNVAAAPGRLRVRIIIDPRLLGQGIGATLHDAIEAEAIACGARELVTEAFADHPRADRFLRARGFREYHRRIDSTLLLAQVEPQRIARAIDEHTDRFFPAVIVIASYRQMVDACSEAPHRLYELFSTLWQDVPFGLSGTNLDFAAFVAEELADNNFLPAGTMVALSGDRWVGLAALSRGTGYLLASMTGVVRDWRGRGLARWLKLHTIRYALDLGIAELRTVNDAINPAILALNRSLGFRPTAIDIRYRKDLR